MNFDQAPMLVIWEVTQACDLSCLHCRACAQPSRSALELTTEEARRMIDEIADIIFGPYICPDEFGLSSESP